MDTADIELRPGRPEPLGATPVAGGVNFSVYAANASTLELLLFDDPEGRTPKHTVALDPKRHRSQGVWHVEVTDDAVASARFYAYRATGPNEGAHRYDPDKVLLDPYARRVHFPSDHRRDASRGPGPNLGRSPLGVMPPALPAAFDWGADARPSHPASRRIIYELHVRGFTQRDPSVPEAHRGTYLGVIDKIPYLKSLGVTTVELMPVQQFDPDEDNYWGYMTLAFFAPHRGYAAGDDPDTEFKTMVRALHAEGIEVLLDVVYNHTTEEDEDGPTYSFRGLDNAAYYVLQADGRSYRDDAGTGNVFKTAHAQVRRLVLDSLRYWATEFRVDGFRYDLASILTRNAEGEPDAYSALVPTIEHDPVLMPLLHIAEPWDLTAYQVGASFVGESWSQWNDRFRDVVRRFVKSDPGLVENLMWRLAGSPDLFPPELPYARLATQSINFVVAHDGFCLNDLVTYNHKHNQANGHDNRDGGDNNHSWNCGHEGEQGAPAEVIDLRRRQRKNLLTLLMLAKGVPMLYMGDEFAHTRGGNNNPYNQDNETSWLDWGRRVQFDELVRFTSRLIAFRLRHPSVTQPRTWTDAVSWYGVGAQPDTGPNSRSLAFALHGASVDDCDMYVMINAYWAPLEFEIQEHRRGGWRKVIDTANPSPADIYDDHDAPAVESTNISVGPRSIIVLRSGR